MGGLSLAQEDVSTLFPVSSPARPPEPVTSRRRPLERGLRMFLTQRTTRWDCSFRWLDTIFHGQYLPSLKLNKLRRHKQRFEKIATTVVLDKDENLLWSGLQWRRSNEVRASHYSGVLSPSFIFSCITIASSFAYVKCIVSYCCSRENETLRQYPWIIRDPHL